MTRASLLHALDCPAALGPAEVRELEQLAQAFPYCQTAHLLLAKAAHDQGTMLAGQRLRRAATYAADRVLLRRLIEEVGPAPEAVVTAPTVAPQVVAQEATADEAGLAAGSATPAEEIPESVGPLPVVFTAPKPAGAPVAEAPVLPTATPPSPLPATESTPSTPEAFAYPAPVIGAGEHASPPAEMAELPNSPQLAPGVLPALVDHEGVDIPTAEPHAVVTHEPEPETEILFTGEGEQEEDLPAQAPAIRPPAEAGDARFEFGLAPTPPPAAPAYELPGLIDEWAASAVTLSMGGPGLLGALPVETMEATPESPIFTPAAFIGDDEVGYGFGESSRLGFSLQLLNLLTAEAENPECTTEQAAARPPTVALPPTSAFFEPDPLLLAHWATHCPPPPAAPSPFDLINNFLRRQPRLTRPAMLPPTPAAQTDLSVRSTRAESDLASESLARILVRQGKTARAIEIYEKLMVKHPEKMAYFAAQIQQLQPLA